VSAWQLAGKHGLRDGAAGDVHLGSDATETVVKRSALADYGLVYFATHGLVAGDVAGLGASGVALVGRFRGRHRLTTSMFAIMTADPKLAAPRRPCAKRCWPT